MVVTVRGVVVWPPSESTEIAVLDGSGNTRSVMACAALCEHLHRRGVDVDVEIEGTCAERHPHRLHGRETGAEQDVS